MKNTNYNTLHLALFVFNCTCLIWAVMAQLISGQVCRPSTYSLVLESNGQKCCPIKTADLVIERAGTRNSYGLRHKNKWVNTLIIKREILFCPYSCQQPLDL